MTVIGTASDIPVNAAGASAPTGSEPAAVVTIADEIEQYTSAIPGAEVAAVRTGGGFGSSVLVTTTGRGFVAASGSLGFPVLGRATLGEDTIAAACITSAPPGSRWCEIDLEPGTVLAYGPEADHHAVSPAGLEYSLAITRQRHLEVIAQQLDLDPAIPPHGQVHALAASGSTNALRSVLAGVVDTAIAGVSPDADGEHDLLHALTAALSVGDRARRVGVGRGIDNRQVALTCIDYVATIGRLPSIRELCLVAHVSERRLREAFREVYKLPPTQYFRNWALSEARRRLTTAEPGVDTVTDIAMDLGFAHTGRFSGHYKALFGEAPSVTLGSRY